MGPGGWKKKWWTRRGFDESDQAKLRDRVQLVGRWSVWGGGYGARELKEHMGARGPGRSEKPGNGRGWNGGVVDTSRGKRFPPWKIMAMAGVEEQLKEELWARVAGDGRGRPAVVRAGLQVLLK